MKKYDKNNSEIDSKGRMLDNPTLRQSTSWPSDGEGPARGQRIITLSERSMENGKCTLTSRGLCCGGLRLMSGKRD